MHGMLIALAIAIAVVATAIALHFMVIELGREVVTLRTQDADGSWKQTRLWVVDYDGDTWLHSAGRHWQRRFEENPEVELIRHGRTGRYRAEPDRSAHAAIDQKLREKYGLADRWVRLLAPCDDSVVPVRLHELPRSRTRDPG